MGKRSRAKRERFLQRSLGQSEREKEIERFSHRFSPSQPLARFCLTVIRWGTYLALFAPLIVSSKFFFPFVAPKSLYFMALTEIVFVAWLILIIYSSQYRPRLNILIAAIVLFVGFLTLSSFFGADFSRSFWSKPERMTGLLMWFHLLAFFLVISSVFQNKTDWSKIFLVSLSAASLVSLLSLFPLAGRISELIKSSRGGSTIGNSSFMGTYLLFNIFFGLWLLLTLPERLQLGSGQVLAGRYLKIYSAILLIIIGLGLFFSDARAAKISLLGGLVLLFFLYLIFKSQKSYLRNLGKGLLITSIITFIILAIFLFQSDSFVQKEFLKYASRDRLIVWAASWRGFLERPWFGWGPENFDFVFTKYYHPCLGTPECGSDIWFDRAHNIIFDTLVATGILGFLSYLGIFAAAILVLGKLFFQNHINFWTAGIFSVVLISYSVQNLTVFDMISSYLMFLLVLGFISSLSLQEKRAEVLVEKPERRFLIPWLPVVILLIFLFSFFKFIIRPLQTDYYVIRALRFSDSPSRLSFEKKALEASPLGKYQIRTFFAEQLIALSEEEKAQKVPQENLEEEFNFIAQELEKSISESALDFRSHLRLGQLYNNWPSLDLNRLKKTEKILEKTIELSPTNQQGYWTLAQTKLYLRDFQTALSLAEKAVELEPKIVRSHFIVIQIAKIMGERELAQKKLEEAIKINPAWEPDLKKILEPT